MKNFCNLILQHEDWLMERILFYAKQRDYTKYTSTLAEAWRLSISGISASLIASLEAHKNPPELGPEDDFLADPSASFGIIEARKHRSRGISISMFLGLMKYYRQTYLDLVQETGVTSNEVEWRRQFIERFFDRIEIGFCQEWSSLSESQIIEELQSSNRSIMNEKNRYLTLFESMRDPAVLLDNQHRIENVNHSLTQLFPYLPAPGAIYYNLQQQPYEWPWFREKLAELAMGSASEMTFETQLHTVNGLCVFQVKLKRMLDVSDKFAGTVVILNDITARKSYEDHLKYLARHDSLTGLLNRYSLEEILLQEAKRSNRYQHPIGLLMVDVDRFKEINDRFGHPAGDEVLKSLAKIIMQQVRESDIVVRYGGDEFLILLLEAKPQTEIIKNRIIIAVEAWSNQQSLTTFPVTLSIGSAFWDLKGRQTIEEALSEADRKMYITKRTSRAVNC